MTTTRFFHSLSAALFAMSTLACGASGDDETGRARLLDRFETAGAWSADASEGGFAELHVVAGEEGRAIQLSYAFPKAAGYAFIRRPISLDLSQNFEMTFLLRGAAPTSAIEVKFVDESGENVWMRRFQAREISSSWETVRIRRSDVAFAWGPAIERDLRKIAAMEIVIVGSADEKGTLEFDSLSMRRIPEPPATPPRLIATAGAETVDGPAEAAVDGDQTTAWRTPADGRPVRLTLDLGYLRNFGGLTLDWTADAIPVSIQASYSEDGQTWSPLRVQGPTAENPDIATAYARGAEAFGRFIRLSATPASGAGVALIEARIEEPAFGSDDTAFLEAVAARAPLGAFPRGFSGEQTYWTIVGGPEGGRTALLSEDGAVEPEPGAFSIEPFIAVDGATQSWPDATHAHWLTENYLPLPHVRRIGADYTLDVSAHMPPADGGERPLIVRYRLVNQSTKRRTLSLLLATRPMQVNPPTQHLNRRGGASPITALGWRDDMLAVNDRWRIRPSRRPDGVSLAGFVGAPLSNAKSAHPDVVQALETPDGFGAAALRFDFDLGPGESAETAIVAQSDAAPTATAATLSAVARNEEAAADEWRAALNRTELGGSYFASPVTDGIRTALAHILMSRDGPALRPGTRSYARAWIRDGAMMAESLLKLGHAGVAADFARWYAPYQFESGRVPCCVDARGADPVPENDSHGEFIYLVTEIYRHTKDRAFAETQWPYVDRAASAIDALRRSERVEENAYFGLLPPSISHEGYSDRPAYSYWDDFWGLEGLNDAAWLAAELDRPARAAELSGSAGEFAGDIAASIARVTEERGLDFIPGAADRGDFDATSTTVAIAPTAVASALPESLLRRSFDRAWIEFLARRDDGKEWDAYTPYEFRQASAFLRLNEPERAHALLSFYLRDRRPAGWNQWAEVVGRDPRAPRFIGDMPHAWVASDFIRAGLDLLVYDDRADETLVIAAGAMRSWLSGDGFNVDRLMTRYGAISYRAAEKDGSIVIRASGDAAPPGGFRLPTAFLGKDFAVTVNGGPSKPEDGAARFYSLPAEIVLTPAVDPDGEAPISGGRLPEPAAGQRAITVTDAEGRQHRLLFYLPEVAVAPADGKKFPLLLFLHGSGGRGDDISRVKAHGPPKMVEGRTDFPFIVASPQIAEGEVWNAGALAGLLDVLLAETPADPDRVYVTGLSLGGHGTWAFAAAHPERVAAIAPVSGAGAPATACALRATPIRAFHGALDEVVPAGGDIAMVEAVNACGGAAHLTIYPSLGHDAWTQIYDNPEIYDWLLAQRRLPQK